MTNRVTHFEITANDIHKTKHFYEHIFNWKIEKWEGDFEYWMITTGDTSEPGINGGIMMPENPLMPKVINTIEVQNLDETLSMIQDHGGKILQPKMSISTVGLLAYFQDPEGNVFGLMQVDENAN